MDLRTTVSIYIYLDYRQFSEIKLTKNEIIRIFWSFIEHKRAPQTKYSFTRIRNFINSLNR